MNRYDVASVAKFNPLSLQEVLLAPTMMRQKHDASIAAAEALRIKADPLDVHLNRALELKNQMDNEIAKNVDELNTNGYNPTTFQNITKLNRQYQDLISPTGEVGQINNAKKVYAENYKEFLDDATKNKGWSRERAIDNWQNRFANKYTGFGEDGKSITNIGQYGAPKKIEVLDKLKDVHSLLGEQVVGEMTASGYSFDTRKDGSMVMVDRSGRRIETSNKPNLNNALALLQNQFVDKEWKDSMQFEGANPLSVASQITNGVNAMLKTGVVDNRGENAQYIAPREGDGSDEFGADYGLTESANNFVSDKFSGLSYSEINEITNKYKNDKTPEGRQKFYEANTFKNSLDKTISVDPEIKKLKDQLNKEETQFTTLKNNPNKQYLNGKLIDSGFKTEQSKNVFRQTQESNYVKRINDIKNKIDNLSQKYVAKTNIESTDYMLTPYTPKQKSILEIADKNIQKLFQTTPENIKSMVNIEAIGTSEGKLLNSVSSEDKETISKVLSRAKEGDVTLNRVAGKGVSGKPEYVLRIIPNDESEKLYGNNKFWSKSKINKEPIEIRVSFKKTKGNSGVDLVNGLITQYVQGAGKKGQQLSQTMRAYAAYGDNSWNDYKTDPNITSRIDNIIENMVIEDNNSPYAELTTSQARERYLKHHGNETINFHDQ